jgi:hypothetical protein
MSVKIDPDDEYSDYLRLASTSQRKAGNKQINRLTRDIGHQTAVRGHMRLWLRITRYNLNKDAKFAKLLGITTPRTMDWYMHETLLQKHPDVFGSSFGQMKFPPELPDDYFEPMGIDYGRYKEWEQIEALMVQLQTGENAVAPGPTEATPQQTPMELGPPQLPIPLLEAQPASPPTNPLPIPNPSPPERQPTAQPTPTPEPTALPPSTPTPSPSQSTPTKPQATKGDIYSAQANWRRDLGGMTQVSYFNTYLLETKALSTFQEKHFWNIVDEVTQVFGPDSYTPQSMAAQVANAWNTVHGRMMAPGQGSVVGLGGLMRQQHAATLLKNRGHEIRSKRALAMSQPQEEQAIPTPVGPVLPKRAKQSLDASGVNDLSYRGCIPWLKKVKRPYYGNLDQRQQRLHDYFAAMPPGHTIEL